MTTTPQEPDQSPEVAPSGDPAHGPETPQTPETDPIEPDAPPSEEARGGPVIPD